MEIEKQCCTIEQAKKLKELGVKQDSLFCWQDMNDFSRKKMPHLAATCVPKIVMTKITTKTLGTMEDYSAFTVAELGEMLPEGYWTELQYGKWNFIDDTNIPNIMSAYYDTEAEARAALLILLLEFKTITATEVNERK